MLIRVGGARGANPLPVSAYHALRSPKNAVFSTDGKQRPSGPGLTQAIGPNAGRMTDMLTDPAFLRKAIGDTPWKVMAARRKELDQVGARGKFTGARGMSKNGDLQFAGKMDARVFWALQWTQPEIFESEESIMRVLKATELAV